MSFQTKTPTTVIARSDSDVAIQKKGLPRSVPSGAMSDNEDADRFAKLLKYTNELLNQRLRETNDGRSSPKRCKEHAVNIKQQEPWLKSTGPKTDDGKAASAQNAYKHGFRGRDMELLRSLLRQQALFVKRVMENIPPIDEIYDKPPS